VIDDARPVGGAQTYLARLCAGTASRGWENVVVADALPVRELAGVVEVLRGTSDAAVVLGADPDVVFLHTVDSAGLAVDLVPRVRTVVYEHDYRHISPGNLRFFQRSEQFCEHGFGARCLLRPYTQRCNSRRPDRVLSTVRRVQRWRGTLEQVAEVLCASEFVSGLVREFAPRARLSVVGYPVDVPAEPLPAAPERLHVLYVGRTSPVKGLHHLVDAFVHVAAGHPGVKLLVAAGPDLDEVRERVERAGIADAVELLGWLEGDALVEAYRRARVLALPSVWPEPFGMAGPEALAYGIPVVASDVGGIRAWHDGVCGDLVPAGDPAALAAALIRFLDDEVAADAAGAAGRARVANDFSLERHLERVVPLVEGPA
jgi:glycosyltransferase involved in cell wall biosynthesis